MCLFFIVFPSISLLLGQDVSPYQNHHDRLFEGILSNYHEYKVYNLGPSIWGEQGNCGVNMNTIHQICHFNKKSLYYLRQGTVPLQPPLRGYCPSPPHPGRKESIHSRIEHTTHMQGEHGKIQPRIYNLLTRLRNDNGLK